MILLVHVLEVFRIAGIFSDILNMNRYVELYLPWLGPVFVTNLFDHRNRSVGLGTCWVKPHVNLTVDFGGRPVLNLGTRRNRFAVRNMIALPVPTELPAVKRALD